MALNRLRMRLRLPQKPRPVTFLAMLAMGFCAGFASPAAADTLFGVPGVKKHSIAPFYKWTGVLKRGKAQPVSHRACRSALRSASATPVGENCRAAEWESLRKSMRLKHLPDQMQAVNQFINRQRYIVDPENWGVEDYWATPLQFLFRNGDCEDYAIAKYTLLKRLGVPAQNMRIVVLQDLNLGVAHAVLAVFDKGRRYILDNQIEAVLEDTRIRHYQPIFSINEAAWWLHKRR